MARLIGLGLVFAASAAAAEPPVDAPFALRPIVVPAPASERDLHLSFEFPKTDYGEPARPSRKLGFIAAIPLAPNALLGVGMSERRAKRSSFAPEADRDTRRGGRKLALRFSLGF